MPTEDCGICDARVPLDDTAHLLVNPPGDGPVTDHYVCRRCYEDDLAALFEWEATDLA